MAVKMRLTRMGDKKSPFYRVVVIDSRKARSGEYIDKIGYVNPLKTPAEINIDVEKAKKWLANGVQPTMEKSNKPSAPKTNDKKKKKD